MVDEVPNWQAIPAREDEKKPGIFNRLSKMINRSEWPGNSEFRSPLFLKRFHLLNENKAKNLPKLPDGELVRLVLSSEYLDVSDYVGRQFLVVRPYAKRLGDELLLCAGEKVIMKRVHPDGWATVEVGGGAGVVPLMCLKKC